MPVSSTIARGNQLFDTVLYLPVVPYPTIGSATTATTTLTIPGVAVGDVFSWNQQGYVATLTLDNIYASAANTITLTWTSTAAITGANTSLLLEVIRPENVVDGGLASIPASIF
jgi:hypothetical protein